MEEDLNQRNTGFLLVAEGGGIWRERHEEKQRDKMCLGNGSASIWLKEREAMGGGEKNVSQDPRGGQKMHTSSSEGYLRFLFNMIIPVIQGGIPHRWCQCHLFDSRPVAPTAHQSRLIPTSLSKPISTQAAVTNTKIRAGNLNSIFYSFFWDIKLVTDIKWNQRCIIGLATWGAEGRKEGGQEEMRPTAEALPSARWDRGKGGHQENLAGLAVKFRTRRRQFTR